jgi:hypothetical protein
MLCFDSAPFNSSDDLAFEPRHNRAHHSHAVGSCCSHQTKAFLGRRVTCLRIGPDGQQSGAAVMPRNDRLWRFAERLLTMISAGRWCRRFNR